MTGNVRRFKQTFLAGLLLFVGGTLLLTAYTVWRLRSEAITSGLEISALHSRTFEGHLTQSLYATELLDANLLGQGLHLADNSTIEKVFITTLQRAPFLRSMSLLGESGQIIASSNPANLGLVPDTTQYLPLTDGKQDILRIGAPWTGRDFATGKPASTENPVTTATTSFVPVIQSLEVDGRLLSLLVALNPDYFINHIVQKIKADEGDVDILRYDGSLLMSTAQTRATRPPIGNVLQRLQAGEIESGHLEQSIGQDRYTLTTFRASSLYPVIVLTHLDRDFALTRWRTETKTLLGFVAAALFVIGIAALYFFRRQLALAAQHAEFERLQKINATVFDSSTEAILVTDIDARIISINDSFMRITGYVAEDVIGHRLIDFLTEESAATVADHFEPRSNTDHFPSIEVQQRCKDGRLLWMEVLSTPQRDAAGNVTGYHRICRNITERKQAEEKLQLSASVFSHAREGIMITAPDGTIIDVNDAFSHITGYSREEALGNSPRLLRSDQHASAFYSAMWQELGKNGHWHGEIWNQRKNGELLAEILTISAIRDAQGNVRQYVALFTYITPLKKHEQELEYIAHFDALTHLPNRLLLADRLRQAMRQADRRGKKLALAFLDLDGFKAVNDQHGHETGDQLLVQIATRMKQALREGDTLARLGGDEFVVVLPDIANVDSCVATLNRILDAAAQPVIVNQVALQVSASLGVTFYPQDAEIDTEQLLRQADNAMYQAKLGGKNRFAFFSASAD